jgi:hypothetical protein
LRQMYSRGAVGCEGMVKDSNSHWPGTAAPVKCNDGYILGQWAKKASPKMTGDAFLFLGEAAS